MFSDCNIIFFCIICKHYFNIFPLFLELFVYNLSILIYNISIIIFLNNIFNYYISIMPIICSSILISWHFIALCLIYTSAFAISNMQIANCNALLLINSFHKNTFTIPFVLFLSILLIIILFNCFSIPHNIIISIHLYNNYLQNQKILSNI